MKRGESELAISSQFSLPIDFVTWTQAILAKKGSGKSYTASVQAEELLAAGQQIVVIDPTGAWWGLRSSADGSASGYPIAVLGGEHGDVPLETAAGEVIADAIASEHFSAVLDLSLFRKAESNRFMGVFLETLYRRNRDALHVIIDEADTVAPQKPFGDEARTLGATEDLVRRGRIRGLGVTLITQRPQVLNKNVLSQVDMLTALRMNHPKDLAAIKEWVEVHAELGQAKAMIDSLPSLPIGEAWIWAPASELFARVSIRRRRTFDSGRTPKAGERAAAPKVLAPVDIARLGQTIADTAERVKENDPKALKARVAELERQLERARTITAPLEVRVAVPTPMLSDADIKRLEVAIERYNTAGDQLAEDLTTVGQVARDLEAAIHLAQQFPAPPAKPGQCPRSRSTAPGDPSLGGGERRILTALAQYPSGRTKQQIAILTGYAHSGGGFNNYVSALRSRGLIEGDAALLRITDAGVSALGSYDPLPAGRALFDHWQQQLGKAEREILRVLFEDWPKAQPKDYVALKAGYQANGGGFNNALSRLRTLELIEGKAKLKASDQLQDGRR